MISLWRHATRLQRDDIGFGCLIPVCFLAFLVCWWRGWIVFDFLFLALFLSAAVCFHRRRFEYGIWVVLLLLLVMGLVAKYIH